MHRSSNDLRSVVTEALQNSMFARFTHPKDFNCLHAFQIMSYNKGQETILLVLLLFSEIVSKLTFYVIAETTKIKLIWIGIFLISCK